MSDDEKQHLEKIDTKLEEQSDLLTEIRIAIARIESRPVCSNPGLCVTLQADAVRRESRLRNLESWRTFLAGAWAITCLVAYLAWDWIKYSLNHK